MKSTVSEYISVKSRVSECISVKSTVSEYISVKSRVSEYIHTVWDKSLAEMQKIICQNKLVKILNIDNGS